MRHLHLPPTPRPGGSASSPPAVPKGHPQSLGPKGRGEPPQRDTLRAELGQHAGWIQSSMAPGWTPFLTAPKPRIPVKRSQLGQQGRCLLPGLARVLTSHASKVILKVLQGMFTVQELRNFRCSNWIYKRQGNQKSNCRHQLDHRNRKKIPEKHLFLLH